MRRKFNSEQAVEGGQDHGKLWFTSDTHFGHDGIMFMRPFDSVGEMDEVLVERWNDVIDPRDHVFHLGDFSFYKPAETLGILAQLHGIKYLVRGNHDRNNLNSACLSMFDGGVEHYHEITVGSQLVTLCHFPFRSWNGMHHDSFNLHGHSHGSMQPSGKQLDVGVDVHDFRPWSWGQIVADMANKKFVKTDHHGSKRSDQVDTYRPLYVARAAEAYINAEPGDLPK